jgi:hypothetical protein
MGFAAYRVEARLSWDGGKKRTEIATLQPPPFTKPAMTTPTKAGGG